MNDIDLLEPEKLYSLRLKDEHHSRVEKYFDDLTKQSGVDIGANKETCTKYYQNETLIQKYTKKLNGQRALMGLFIAMIVAGVILFAIAFLLKTSVRILFFIFGPALLILGIVLLCTVYRNNAKKFKSELSRLTAIGEQLKLEALKQMSALNRLFDPQISSRLFSETVPLIQMDRIFDAKKFEMLKEKYGLWGNEDEERSTLNLQSGTILGNPFVFFKDKVMKMMPHRYEGTLVITYTTRHVDSKGHSYTITHTQTLHAFVTKPRPEYSKETYLIYGNEAAPHLSFKRLKSNINSMDEKGIEKYVHKNEKNLTKLAEKQMSKGGTYTPLGNSEFELFFGGLDRDHEVEYRLLFTPLAQKAELALLKSKVGFGDDFNMQKIKMINIVESEHSQGDSIFAQVEDFRGFDYEVIKEHFITFNDYYFKAVYFDFAPLMAIPLYQQYKPREYIYRQTYKGNFAPFEHETIANRYHLKDFMHPDSDTDAIIKTVLNKNMNGIDEVNVISHSYKAVSHVEIVPTLGGDGRMHGVPVTWYEYVPLTQSGNIIHVADVGGTLPEFNRLGNKDVIYERGLVSSSNLLNVDINSLKSRMAKKEN